MKKLLLIVMIMFTGPVLACGHCDYAKKCGRDGSKCTPEQQIKYKKQFGIK